MNLPTQPLINTAMAISLCPSSIVIVDTKTLAAARESPNSLIFLGVG